MASPTFTATARIVDENGAAPSGSFTWQINTFANTSDTAVTSPGQTGRVSAQVTSTDGGTSGTMTVDATGADYLLQAYTIPYEGQFNPSGVYTDVSFATLVVRKGGAALTPVTNIEFSVTTGGTTYTYTAALVGSSTYLLVFWANPTTLRPVAQGTSGAVARAESSAKHAELMRDEILSLVGGTPVPLCQNFILSTTFDPGATDLNLDTYSRGYEAIRNMGFNTPIHSGFVHVPHRARIRQRQLTAGLHDWSSVNQARPPGAGFRWKTSTVGDTGHNSTDAGIDGWAQYIYDAHIEAQYPVGNMKFLVGWDEPSHQYPWENDLANTGTNTVAAPHPSAGYVENADSALAKSLLAQFIQDTYRKPDGTAYAPADFGLAAWSDATFHGPEFMGGTLAERRLMVATAEFIPWHIADFYGQRCIPALNGKFGYAIPSGFDLNNFVLRHFTRGQAPEGASWSQDEPVERWATGAPDPFFLAKRGHTFLASDGWFGDFFGWTWSYRSSLFRQHSQTSCLLIPMYSQRRNGLTQQVMSLVGHGAKKLQNYQNSPEYVRPNETMSERVFIDAQVGNVTGLANVHRMMAQSEDLSYPGTPLGGRKVAIYFSRSSQHFDAFTGMELSDSVQSNVYALTVDWKLDEVGMARCLIDMNVPFDFVDQDDVIAGKLTNGNYGLLYCSAPNVPARAKAAIESWVDAGGVLDTSPGAGRFDWDNEPHASSLASLGGITETARNRKAIQNAFNSLPNIVEIYDVAATTSRTFTPGELTNATDMRTALSGVASGDVVARFADDDSPAMVDVVVGSGRHIHRGYFPGVSYVRHGSSTGEWQHFDTWPAYTSVARELNVTRPLARLSNYKRPVEVDKVMVECPVLASAQGWAIWAINWGQAAGTYNWRIRPPFTPSPLSVKRADGTTIPLTSTADGYTFSASLDETGEVLRVYQESGGATPTPATVTTTCAVPSPTVVTSDETAPVRESLFVSANLVFVRYDEELDTTTAPAPGNYVVKIQGVPTTINAVAFSDAFTVRLTLAVNPSITATVRASYTPGANPVRDLAGNQAQAFNDEVVFHGSPDATVAALPVTVALGVPSPTVSAVKASSGTGEESYVTAPNVVNPRNNFGPWVGYKFTVGGSALTVNAVGRWMLEGNTGTHTVKIVKASDGTDVPGGSASVSMSGGTVNSYVRANLASPITLNANTAYYVVSEEVSGGDTWSDETTPSVTLVATVDSSVYSSTGSAADWNLGTAGKAFAVPTFWYDASGTETKDAQIGPTPAAALTTVPVLTIQKSDRSNPAVVPSFGAAPLPALLTGSTAKSAVVTAIGEVPASAPQVPAIASPAAVGVVAAAPAPSASASHTAGVAAVVSVASAGSPTPSTGATPSTSDVAAVTGLAAPAQSASSTPTVAVAAAVTVTPAPSLSTGSNPPVVATTASIPDPVVIVDSGAAAQAAVVASAAGAGTAQIEAGSITSPGTVNVATTALVAVARAGATSAPASLPATVAEGGSSLLGDPAVVAYWKANQYDGTSQVLQNLKSPGTHDAQLGSTSGADANDPLWLPYSAGVGKYAYLPGTSGNYVSTPDHASLDITGDIDIRARVALDDWTPPTVTAVVAKFAGSGAASYLLRVNTSGTVRLDLSADGSALASASSSVAAPFSDGSVGWVRATWRASDGRVQFFTSNDGTTWTPLGADQTVAIASIASGTAPLELGSHSVGTTGMLAGKVYAAQVRNGIDGTVVANFDATQTTEPHSTVTDSTGKVWTFNRASSGRKLAVVDRSLFLLGSDDYFEAPNHADLNFGPTDSFSVALAVRQYGTPSSSFETLLAKKTAAAATASGYSIELSNSNNVGFRYADGAVGEIVTRLKGTSGTVQVWTAVRDVGQDLARIFVGTETSSNADDTSASLANVESLRIGRYSGTGTNYAAFEFIAAAIVRRALTNLEISELGEELLKATAVTVKTGGTADAVAVAGESAVGAVVAVTDSTAVPSVAPATTAVPTSGLTTTSSAQSTTTPVLAVVSAPIAFTVTSSTPDVTSVVASAPSAEVAAVSPPGARLTIRERARMIVMG